MKSITDILQQSGLRLALCAITLGFGLSAAAQTADDGDDDAQEVKKAPKRKAPVAKYPTIEVRGTVTDQTSRQPIAGVQVQALGNKLYTAMTDEKGQFTIKVPKFATALYVHTSQYLAQQVAINAGQEGQELSIAMLSDRFRAMYGEGTDYTAKASFNATSRNVSIDDEITGKLGGDVRAITRSGAPGIGAAMFVRGLGSINGGAQPLVVIDGQEIDMQLDRQSLHLGQFNNILANISPDDIEKVTVLKNATALYGARGANGVIVIDTKRGHSMATRIDANVSVGLSLIPRLPTLMNAGQYRNYATEMLGTISANTDRTTPIEYKFLDDNPAGYYYHKYHNDTDWKDEAYHTGFTQNYGINVQGGDAVGMYNLSVGYMKGESTARENDIERMNVRFNTDIKITDDLSTKFDLSIARTNINVFDDGAPADLESGTLTSPTFLSLIKSPIVAPNEWNTLTGGFSNMISGADDIYDQLDGNLSLANPKAILTYGSGDNHNRAETTFFNIRFAPTYKIGRDWRITEDFSYTLNRNAQRYHRPFKGVPSYQVEGIGKVTSMAASFFSKENVILSNTRVDFSHIWGKHTLAAYAGFRYAKFNFDDSDLSTEYNGETNDKNPTLSATPYPGVTGVNDKWKTMQWYANADYNYMNRYFATLSLLGEANSRFGDNADAMKLFGVRWAIFPSVQLGWVMTNESWFPKNAGIDYLRINAGFDMSGNDGISNYAAKTSFSPVRYNKQLIGLQMTNIGNDEIKWETTYKWNAGFEANMLNNRLSLAFNYYIHKTKDLLTLQSFANPIAGINRYWTNGGELQNTGFEASFAFKPIVSKDWNLELGATIGHYKNKVTKLPEGSYTSSVYGQDNIITQVGSPIALFYGYRTAGVFASDADAAKATTANADGYLRIEDNTGATQLFRAGDVRFIDANGDGKISDADKTVIGDPNPDIYGNIFAQLSWRDITLSLGFNYSLGNDVFNYQRSILNSGSTLYNQQVKETARWRYEGQQTDMPRAAFGDPMGNNRFSDRWIEDGSYLRLKTLNVAYRVPVPSAWSTWLQGLTVWAECQNLFTITKYLGSDPEFSVANSVYAQGIDCGNIALGRNFLFGVKVNL